MNYRQTRIYQQAIALNRLSSEVIANLPAGYGFLADQLRRASSSIALNFAEGHDKCSCKEQQRYFRVALGSTNEVAAVFDVARALGVVSEQRHVHGIELSDHLARMLHRFRR